MRLARAAAPRPLAALLALATLAACTDGTGPRASAAVYSGPDPIVFVHGWNASASTWNTMVTRFKADGYTAQQLVAFSYNTSQSNATTASLIAKKVDSVLAATGASRVDLVSHSMGALSARYYVKNLGGAAKVDAWVSLGGPNHGTSTAYACLQTSCLQMWPKSSFLNGLNTGDETPLSPRYATWWSPCDEVINPHSSTPLSGATNTQTSCLSHSALHEDAAVYAQVRTWLGGAPAVLVMRS